MVASRSLWFSKSLPWPEAPQFKSQVFGFGLGFGSREESSSNQSPVSDGICCLWRLESLHETPCKPCFHLTTFQAKPRALWRWKAAKNIWQKHREHFGASQEQTQHYPIDLQTWQGLPTPRVTKEACMMHAAVPPALLISIPQPGPEERGGTGTKVRKSTRSSTNFHLPPVRPCPTCTAGCRLFSFDSKCGKWWKMVGRCSTFLLVIFHSFNLVSS